MDNQALELELQLMSKEEVKRKFIEEYTYEPLKSFTKKKMIASIVSIRNAMLRSKGIREYKSK